MPPTGGSEHRRQGVQAHPLPWTYNRNPPQTFNSAPPPTFSPSPAPHQHNNFSTTFQLRAQNQTPFRPAPIHTPLPPPPPNRAPPQSPRVPEIPTTPPTLHKPLAFDHSRASPPDFNIRTKLQGAKCHRIMGMQEPKPFLRPPFVPRGFFGRVGEVWRNQARERNESMDVDMDDDVYLQMHMREDRFGRMKPARSGVEKSAPEPAAGTRTGGDEANEHDGGNKIKKSTPSFSSSADRETGAAVTADKPKQKDDSKARRILGLTEPAARTATNLNLPQIITIESSPGQNIPSKRSHPAAVSTTTTQLKRSRSTNFLKTTLSSSMPLLQLPSRIASGSTTTTTNPLLTRKRPIYTPGLSQSLLTWHVAMWNVWNVYKPSAEQMKLHPLFSSYPPVHTINRKCVSISFWDTSTEPHRELYFVGPGDFDELLYAEVDTFSLGDGNKENVREGRWAFIVLQNNDVDGGGDGNRRGEEEEHRQQHPSSSSSSSSARLAPPPPVHGPARGGRRREPRKSRCQWLMIAWPVSAVTKKSECLQCIYPDAPPPPNPNHPPQEEKQQNNDNNNNMIVLNRYTHFLGKAGDLPLVEGNGVDVAIVQGFVEAVGRGQGKVMVYSERV
ncbi:hypothetical protein DM02DRAFT_656906 [Periconia macrospinosa]|uniref:Uncharacterized protein n=1 Tax=Periconia macrospinosa TaxID=97972 RepID=A0A2V1DLQ0_9PLEO|nr:hypothetical protein DM02DRAFT_656906 [Periconia macrospinosa]